MKLFNFLFCFFPFPCHSTSVRWLLLGGYTGFEGDEGTLARDEIELLELADHDNFHKKSNWCQRLLPSAAQSLDGATVDIVNTFKFMEDHEGDSTFTSSHNTVIQDRLLVCGGSDNKYEITNRCR